MTMKALIAISMLASAAVPALAQAETTTAATVAPALPTHLGPNARERYRDIYVSIDAENWADAATNLAFLAGELLRRGPYSLIECCYLELAEPNIAAGGEACVEAGAVDVILLPFFLSPGRHVVEDLTAARDALAQKFTAVRFVLAEALGSHPSILDVLEDRAREAETLA